ncbi:ABC transporter ATP-binding protein [Natrialba asiatica]|uniref:Monosaccharide-transporting ATPase n=1 Tax=Natrialba asiatica (strain ATCC 700177 / DSM 12278 / JCM 9576 / FERM P-10747 / NBRC 102637 / 172P1) TaxID=29540 RepID=M0AYS3_NATA1|nr:ABC transporter ATP-binding protein [Natrialba asiatica]ELZ02554.1 Monosaccharide-transporting ATPase [Natrialba asiatica DSM 12278]
MTESGPGTTDGAELATGSEGDTADHGTDMGQTGTKTGTGTGAETGAGTDLAVHLDGITKRFPGVTANDDVDLRVERGSVHALLGENGAGKTTLMNVLYGLYHPEEGRVVVDGRERAFDSPQDAIDAGIGMIHQHFMLVDSMTVAENIALGNEPTKWFGLAVDREQIIAEITELCDRYGFDVDPEATVEDLSVGVQQRVEILKALFRGADVLILDEPTAVLTPQEVEGLYDVLEELTAQGKTIIFITHKLEEATHAADAITILRDGESVGTVAPERTDREDLAERMVGREVLLEADSDPVATGDVVLSTQNVAVEDEWGVDVVSGIDLDVRAGEIVGIAGVDGNGQAELIEAITGLRTPDEGTVTYEGTDITDWSRRKRIDAGMSYIPEDRHKRGLVMPFDLVENSILGSQRDPEFAPDGRIDWTSVRDHTDDLIDTYDVRPPDANADASSFSGGNQQKFIVGREFERDPSLVIATHPTRGVDIGSTEFIHDRLLELRQEGVAIVLVSSKLDEVRALSDRLAVMYEGEFIDMNDPDAITEEELGLLMAGEQLDEGANSASSASPADIQGGESR